MRFTIYQYLNNVLIKIGSKSHWIINFFLQHSKSNKIIFQLINANIVLLICIRVLCVPTVSHRYSILYIWIQTNVLKSKSYIAPNIYNCNATTRLRRIQHITANKIEYNIVACTTQNKMRRNRQKRDHWNKIQLRRIRVVWECEICSRPSLNVWTIIIF